MAAARNLVLDQGYLPVAPQDLAVAAGVSKALVYRYFPQPQDVYNALLDEAVEAMTRSGTVAAAADEDVAASAVRLADAYYRHIAAEGPLIQVILRDRFMAGRASSWTAAVRDRAARSLARGLRREFGTPLREAVASVGMGLALPEECGRLAFQGDLDVERGAAMCRELVLGVVDVARRRGSEARG